jgi:transposase InsO family protein
MKNIGIIDRAFKKILDQKSKDSYLDRLRKIAKLQRLSKEALRHLEWMIYYETHDRNATKTARYFGIAPKTFWKWHKRFDNHNLKTLEPHSRAPKTRRKRQIMPYQEERIVELRKKFIRYGKIKIALRYEMIYGEKISSWQVQKVIEKYKLYYNPAKNYRTQKKRARAEKKKRITELSIKQKTFFLFRLDTIVRHWEGKKRYILTAIDTVSRLAFAHMYTSHKSKYAADFLYRLRHLTNGKIENLQTDNGCEFHKDFEKACKELKIPHYWSRVRTPQDNPHCERFNRTLQEEFVQLGNRIHDPNVFNRKLTEWLIEYNYFRPHESLGYVSPMLFIQKQKTLLPMYSSCTVI